MIFMWSKGCIKPTLLEVLLYIRLQSLSKVQSDTIKWKSKQRNGRKLSLPLSVASEIRSNCRSRNREIVRKGLRTGIRAYPRKDRKQRVRVFNHAFIIYRLMNWKFSRWVCSFNCYSSQWTEERQKMVVRDQIGCDGYNYHPFEPRSRNFQIWWPVEDKDTNG